MKSIFENYFRNYRFKKHSNVNLAWKSPYFLTDPRDGSLYIFTSKEDGGLKKFPYTIAELVSASPSKSADGFLYTGDKKGKFQIIVKFLIYNFYLII